MPDVVASAVAAPASTLPARDGLHFKNATWWALRLGGRCITDRAEETVGPSGATLAVARAGMREYGNSAAPTVLERRGG
ncbi:hypothetical protein NGM37_40145, partial [Streptomyces sp. TRM76130]|nr:hypothetical protein [Streptomyces sp. TRM76130]